MRSAAEETHKKMTKGRKLKILKTQREAQSDNTVTHRQQHRHSFLHRQSDTQTGVGDAQDRDNFRTSNLVPTNLALQN